jgi:hypothetical protein
MELIASGYGIQSVAAEMQDEDAGRRSPGRRLRASPYIPQLVMRLQSEQF